MLQFSKLFFPSLELKNHFLTQFIENRYEVINSAQSENYFKLMDAYEGQAMYIDEYTSSSEINYEMIVEQFSIFPTYNFPFSEINLDDCIKLVKTLNSEYNYQTISNFKSGIFFSKRDNLKHILKFAFENVFFKKFPRGKIISIRLDYLYYKRSAMLRGLYSINNYPDIKDKFKEFDGFNTMKNWLFIESHETLSNILLFAEYFFFPYIPAFHCNYNIGLTFVFVPDDFIKYSMDTYPRDILDFLRSATDFGKENASNTAFKDEYLYAKYCFAHAPKFDEYYEFIIWAIESSNKFIKEYLDICSFRSITDNTVVDPIYALEYNLSIQHLMKIGLSILASNSAYFNKSMTFQSADIYSDICNYNKLKIQKDYMFKLLFDKDNIIPIISKIIISCPFALKYNIIEMVKTIYNRLEDTTKESIWLKYKISNNGVFVRNNDLTGDNMENISTFTSNVIRALRNTHHGYLTRNDRSKRPSRYLSLVDGNIPDMIGSLPLIWLLCLIQDRNSFIGEL